MSPSGRSSVSGLVVIASLSVARALASPPSSSPMSRSASSSLTVLRPSMGHHARQALAEDALRTEAVATAEAARAQVKADSYSVPREVSYRAGVVAVDARRGAAAAGALGLRPDGLHDQ